MFESRWVFSLRIISRRIWNIRSEGIYAGSDHRYNYSVLGGVTVSNHWRAISCGQIITQLSTAMWHRYVAACWILRVSTMVDVDG